MAENSELLAIPEFENLPEIKSPGSSARRRSCISKRATRVFARAIPRTPCLLFSRANFRRAAKSAAKRP